MFYLARHGETNWNACGRLQGRLGSALTPKGYGQARALAVLAHRLGITRVLSSPLDRARITARIVADSVSCRLETFDALSEIDFGLCSGLTLEEVAQRFPGLMDARRIEKWSYRWPEGESYADASARLETWLAAETIVPPKSPTMIVAHQSVHRSLTSLLSDKTPDEVLEGKQSADLVLRITPDGAIFHSSVSQSVGGGPIAWSSGLSLDRSLSVG